MKVLIVFGVLCCIIAVSSDASHGEAAPEEVASCIVCDDSDRCITDPDTSVACVDPVDKACKIVFTFDAETKNVTNAARSCAEDCDESESETEEVHCCGEDDCNTEKKTEKDGATTIAVSTSFVLMTSLFVALKEFL